MSQKPICLAILISGVFAVYPVSGQQSGHYYGPPSGQSANSYQGCQSGCCQSNGGCFIDANNWTEPQSYVPGFESGCDCTECSQCADIGTRRMRRTPLRNILNSQCAQPECADCNWGPIYLGLFGGVSFIDNFKTRFTFDNGMMGMLGVQETGFSIRDGVAAGGSIGRYFYRQARVEFEYTYRDNGIGDMSVNTYSDDLSTPQNNDTLISSVVMPAVGNLESNSFMFNIVFDMKPRTIGCMNAYLGGGIGALYVDGDATTATATFLVDDSSFAFQGIAGINYPVRDRIDLFTEYRYLGARHINVDRTDMAGTVSLGDFRFDSHNVVFGLRLLR